VTRDGIISAAIALARASRHVVDNEPALDGKLRALQDAMLAFDEACLQIDDEAYRPQPQPALQGEELTGDA
jgi:hypothetical protein